MPGFKIKGIKASGLLSFKDIELKDLNKNVNFIVGPNGSGKTNFAKLMGFIKFAILNPYNFPYGAIYAANIKNYLKKDSHKIEIEADIDLSLDDNEIKMVSSAIAMIFIKNPNNYTDYDYKFSLPNAISFFEYLWKKKFKNGKLVIEYDDVTQKHSILYKSINEENIAIDIVNNFLITGYHKSTYDSNQNIFNFQSKDEKTKKEFIDNINNNNFNDWLNRDLKYNLTLGHFDQFGRDNKKEGESNEIIISDVIRFAKKNFVKDKQHRVSISTIFMWIFENSITILDNFRCPLKNILSIKEINETQNFNSNNLYSYLMQLKINKFNDYEKVKKIFSELSNNKDFDIRIKEINDFLKKDDIFPSPLPQTEGVYQAQIIRNTNSVEVSVEDHKLELELYFKDTRYSEEYPFEFSPAGYYEMLTLSAIIAGNNNKLIILDEPAQNLHPTFQNKLLFEISNHAKDNKNQFFVITHSPHLIPSDFLDFNKHGIGLFRFFKNSEEDSTKLKNLVDNNVDDGLRSIIRANIDRIKRAPFVNLVIVVEGIEEQMSLPALLNFYFQFNIADHDIEVIHSHGKGNVDTYKKIFQGWGIKTLSIKDKDNDSISSSDKDEYEYYWGNYLNYTELICSLLTGLINKKIDSNNKDAIKEECATKKKRKAFLNSMLLDNIYDLNEKPTDIPKDIKDIYNLYTKIKKLIEKEQKYKIEDSVN